MTKAAVIDFASNIVSFAIFIIVAWAFGLQDSTGYWGPVVAWLVLVNGNKS